MWLTEADIDLAAQTGTMVCHNASSNLRLRSGVAPLNALRGARRTASRSGLDEAGINDDRDMFQEMRLVLRLHRVPGMDDAVPTCPQVLRMATEAAPPPPRSPSASGRHRPRQGRRPRADPVAAASPIRTSTPTRRSSTRVVHRGRASAVHTYGRRARSCSATAAHARRQERRRSRSWPHRCARRSRPDEQRRRELSRAVFPHVKHFYDGWLDESARRPFYAPSSRV